MSNGSTTLPSSSTTLPRILVLVGPTASGKTSLSLDLADALNGEIISADSRQVFRYLDIGTAKPTPEERARAVHHFVDERLPDETFSAGQFGQEGRAAVQEILDRSKTPIVVGGSGLYLRSLIDGLFEGPEADPEIREILESKVARGEIVSLIEELKGVDPEMAGNVDPTKPRRIIRALEVFYITGKPLSDHHRESRPEISFTPIQIGLGWGRKELYRRIEKRCDSMIRNGLLEEITSLEERGYDRRLNALNTVGYAEGFALRAGEIDQDEMERLFRQNSRRYAKRQLTWFRGDKRINWVPVGENRIRELVVQEILDRFGRA